VVVVEGPSQEVPGNLRTSRYKPGFPGYPKYSWDTLWQSWTSLDAVCCTSDAVLATLAEIAEDFVGAKAVEATGLLLQVKSFKVSPFPCHFWQVTVTICNQSPSDALQSTSLDLARAADLVSATIETLEDFRSDHEWDHLFAYIESVANLHSIDLAGAHPHRKRTLPNWSTLAHGTIDNKSAVQNCPLLSNLGCILDGNEATI